MSTYSGHAKPPAVHRIGWCRPSGGARAFVSRIRPRVKRTSALCLVLPIARACQTSRTRQPNPHPRQRSCAPILSHLRHPAIIACAGSATISYPLIRSKHRNPSSSERERRALCPDTAQRHDLESGRAGRLRCENAPAPLSIASAPNRETGRCTCLHSP